ncbi:MAG: CAP domain-containing protein [Frankiaceae bacterium]
MPRPRLLPGLTALGLLAGALLAATTPAEGSTPAARFVAAVNAARAGHGLPALRVATDMTAVAAAWAGQMAGAHDIAHDPQLRTAITGWRALGENVGMGPDVASISAAFMGSAPHRANILDPHYTDIGVGAAVGTDGTLYVVEDFRQPTRPATTGPSPAPRATPATPALTTPRATSAPPAAAPRPAHAPAGLASPAAPRPRPRAPAVRPLVDRVAVAVGFTRGVTVVAG